MIEMTLQSRLVAPRPAETRGDPGRSGVLGIVAGILYAAGVANHMSFLVGSTHKGHHQLRLAVSFVLGVVLLAGAWFLRRGGPRPAR